MSLTRMKIRHLQNCQMKKKMHATINCSAPWAWLLRWEKCNRVDMSSQMRWMQKQKLLKKPQKTEKNARLGVFL